MQVTRIIERDMAHRVPNHKSKCKNLHGHRYKALITLSGDIITQQGSSDEGMVIDFSDIKTIAKGYIDTHRDHGYMCQTDDKIGTLAQKLGQKVIMVDFVPTAENIVAHLFKILEPLFLDTYNTKLQLEKIILYETPNCFVEYHRG